MCACVRVCLFCWCVEDWMGSAALHVTIFRVLNLAQEPTEQLSQQ